MAMGGNGERHPISGDVREAEKPVLIITSVSAERDAVLKGLQGAEGFEVAIGGVGPVAAAVSAASLLAKSPYRLVVSAGIGGGFSQRAAVGSIVVADEIIAADLGAETPDGFLRLDELGFGPTRMKVEENRVTLVTEALRKAGLPVVTGPILTVATVTGTLATAEEMLVRVPDAAAEGMEGFGIAAAALTHGVPVLEIRTISNAVGPRDRDAWRIDEALEKLAVTMKTLRKVL